MVTGIIGAVTGISGAIMGYVSYRKSNEIKSLDLRLELRKSINNFNSSLSQAEELLPYANKSRERVASATGKLRSGAMQVWKDQYENDLSALNYFSEKSKILNKEYETFSPKDLEAELVNLHKLQNQLNELKNKYDNAVKDDDKEREHIRNRHETVK